MKVDVVLLIDVVPRNLQHSQEFAQRTTVRMQKTDVTNTFELKYETSIYESVSLMTAQLLSNF